MPIHHTPIEPIKQHHHVDHIKWPEQLRHPKDLIKQLRNLNQKYVDLQLIKSPSASKVVILIVSSWSYLVSNILNKTYIKNHQVFNEQLIVNKKSIRDELTADGDKNSGQDSIASPLLTLSNHTSCIDDPLIWGALMKPLYCFKNIDLLRWAPAANEVCFGKQWHASFFALGKSFPIKRGAGLNQQAIYFSRSLLDCNQWLHFFPEGRVMRDKAGNALDNEKDYGYKFKWGVSKLIMDYFFLPKKTKSSNECNVKYNSTEQEKKLRILPMYHLGIDSVLPIGWPYLPRVGKVISIYIRPSVIELTKNKVCDILDTKQYVISEIVERRLRKNSNSRSKLSVEEFKRIKLTRYLEDEIEALVMPAKQFHNNNCTASKVT